MVYLPSEPHKQRTHAEVQQWVIMAESTNESVYGVKGNSILAGHIDVVKGVPIDYMHSVLEGVTKSMVSYWFDSKTVIQFKT